MSRKRESFTVISDRAPLFSLSLAFHTYQSSFAYHIYTSCPAQVDPMRKSDTFTRGYEYLGNFSRFLLLDRYLYGDLKKTNAIPKRNKSIKESVIWWGVGSSCWCHFFVVKIFIMFNPIPNLIFYSHQI